MNIDNSVRHRHAKPARTALVGESEARRVEAEFRTTQALERLPEDEWTVIRDLSWPGGRYGHVDHVVVGPSGVYVIDTELWDDEVTVTGGRLRHGGHAEDHVARSMTEAAASVAMLTPGVPLRQVRAVVCVAGVEGFNDNVGSLLVCSTDMLTEMLEERVQVMSTHQMTIAVEQLREHLHDGHLVKVAAKAGRRRGKASKRPKRPRRRVPVIRMAIAAWFLATAVLAPQAFQNGYEEFHNFIARQVQRF
ncbi:nuclease-related domain-containing protein [Nocardioides sp.]|uniref:nuclease-related domain-containing protein n=1 Tax=Nocardioides sp. TaxID=35761 RepID=UPI0035686DA3